MTLPVLISCLLYDHLKETIAKKYEEKIQWKFSLKKINRGGSFLCELSHTHLFKYLKYIHMYKYIRVYTYVLMCFQVPNKFWSCWSCVVHWYSYYRLCSLHFYCWSRLVWSSHKEYSRSRGCTGRHGDAIIWSRPLVSEARTHIICLPWQK